jgi:hypothetical protein
MVMRERRQDFDGAKSDPALADRSGMQKPLDIDAVNAYQRDLWELAHNLLLT